LDLRENPEIQTADADKARFLGSALRFWNSQAASYAFRPIDRVRSGTSN